MTTAPVIVDRHEGWAEVILNRPDRKNALVGPLAEALSHALRELATADDIRAVVLRGAGGAFCSGIDLAEFRADEPPAWVADFPALWLEVHQAIFDLPQPLIVAVERYAINGGAALALAGDVCVVGEGTFIEVSEAKMGMAAPRNMFWLRLRHPESVIARLTLLCDRVPAAELHRLGIASEIVADDQVLIRATEVATHLATFPPGALADMKASYRIGAEGP